MKTLKQWVAFSALTLGMCTFANAEYGQPVIEVGATTNAMDGNYGFLIHVEYPGILSGTYNDTYIARMKSTVVTDGSTIPQFEIEIQGVMAVDRHNSYLMGFGDLTVSKDVRVGENLAAKLTAIAFETGLDTRDSAKKEYALAATVALDAIGAKLAYYADQSGGLPFAGFELANIAGKLQFFFPSVGSVQFSIVAGGQADVAFGSSHGFAVQSDRAFFAGIEAEFSDHWSAFIQFRNRAVSDSGNSIGEGANEIRGGVRVKL